MNWLESLIYGLVSGISEFMPISSSAHQALLLQLFGINTRDPVQDLFVHFALLAAVFSSTKTLLDQMNRERSSDNRDRHMIRTNSPAIYDGRLIRAAVLPQVLTMFVLRFVFDVGNNFLITAMMLAISGVVIFLPERMVQGNKDARSMSPMEAVLIGAAGGLSALHGISRIGCIYSVAIMQGAAKKHAITWSLVLSIYALICICLLDLISAIAIGAPNFWRNLFTYIFSGLTAYLGGRVSISVFRFLITRPSNNGFAYYCWGCSLFMFILHLAIV